MRLGEKHGIEMPCDCAVVRMVKGWGLVSGRNFLNLMSGTNRFV